MRIVNTRINHYQPRNEVPGYFRETIQVKEINNGNIDIDIDNDDWLIYLPCAI